MALMPAAFEFANQIGFAWGAEAVARIERCTAENGRALLFPAHGGHCFLSACPQTIIVIRSGGSSAATAKLTRRTRFDVPMALLATRFRSNDWEDELGKALASFEFSLGAEQRAGFCAIQKHAVASPPTVRDVMNLTAEVDYKARQQKKGAHRCLSPRFTKLLEAVQQYASIGDVLIGGSQNLIACGVWSLVRTSLLTVCKFASYFENMSLLCMKIGQSAPRLQEIASLFPHSKAIRGLVAQYFISVVGLCQKMVVLCQQSLFGQMKTFLHDGDTSKYETELVRHADAVQAQLQVEQAKATSRIQSTVSRLSSSETHRRNLENHLRILDWCSTYNYKSTWKRIRKLGNAVWTFAEAEYGAWLGESESATLLVRGKLGSGKSVLLANMVDDMNLKQLESRTAYFFCREDDDRSLECRTILGCLAHQLLQPLPPRETSLHIQLFANMDSDDVVRALKLVLGPATRVLFILDGIEACSPREREEVMSTLRQLQEAFQMALCISYSIDASAEMERETSSLSRQSLVTLPDNRPEIIDYIEAELLARLDNEKLRIGDPNLIVEIQDALMTGAQGMFLWVHMQIEAICMEKTDQEIREALKALPRSLPEVFRRILSRCRLLAPKHQMRALQLLAVSIRPLHLDEFEEAISISPGDARITRAQIVNDVQSVLASCGSLVMVDEELSTIHFIHHSVQQFVLGRCHETGGVESPDYPFSEAAAQIQMGEAVVTYLAWGGFDSVVSKAVVPEISIGSMPNHIVRSLPYDASPVKAKAIELLRRRLKPKELDIGKVVAGYSEKFSNRVISQFHFRDYAQEYWLHHTKRMDESSPAIFALFTRLVSNGRLLANAALWRDNPPIQPPLVYEHEWARYHCHAAMLKLSTIQILRDFLHTEEEYLFSTFSRSYEQLKTNTPDAANDHRIQDIARFHRWFSSQLEIIQKGNGRDMAFSTLARGFDAYTQGPIALNRHDTLELDYDSILRQLGYESMRAAHLQRLAYYQRRLQELRSIICEPTTRRYITLGIMAVDRQLEEPMPPGSDSPIEKALETLILGVEDWKEVKVEALGKLLLHGPYPLPKCGQEGPLELYLFETALLCLRRIPLDQRAMGGATAHERAASFELKGQWCMADITVNTCGAPGLGNQNCLAPELGELHVQVRWFTDRGAGFFIQFDSPPAVEEWMALVSANRKRSAVYENGSTLQSGWLSSLGTEENRGPQLRRAQDLEAWTAYREGGAPGTA